MDDEKTKFNSEESTEYQNTTEPSSSSETPDSTVTPDSKKSLDSLVGEARVDYNKHYIYADYLTWDKFDERWELIDGVPYLMSSPTIQHQRISFNLTLQLGNFLKGKKCRIFYAPFEVRLNAETTDDTVVQPDLLVICDHDKFTKRGCKGAPEMVIEILSPSTSKRDRTIKYDAYLKAGIIEYWIIDPDAKILTANILNDNRYIAYPYTDTDNVAVHVLDGCIISLSDVFED